MPTWYPMISIKKNNCYYYTVSKTTIIVHVCSYTLNIYETAMPYMSLNFFRLISLLDLSAEKGQRIAIC